jgi:hypothetical protein
MPQVFLPGGVSQVPDAIISGLAIDVIDLSGRTFAMNVEPSEAMGVVKAAIDLNAAVAVVVAGPGLEPCGGVPARDAPIKAARFW